MMCALMLALLDFNKIFEVNCNASHVGIGTILSREGQPIVYFSEKLNDAYLNYSKYKIEFYTIVHYETLKALLDSKGVYTQL